MTAERLVENGRRAGLCVIAVALVLVTLALAGSAEGEVLRPWWGITAGTRPASLQPGSGKSEVQELTFSSESVFELVIGAQEVGFFATEPYFALFEGQVPQATAANVQAALESPSAYGPGNVEVVARGAGGESPLIITSIGKDADKSVESLHTRPFFIPLGSSSAGIVTEGRPDGKVVVAVENLGDANANGETEPVTITATLPAKLRAMGVEAFAGSRNEGGKPGTLGPVNCAEEGAGGPLKCTFSGVLPPYSQIEMVIPVAVQAGASSGETTNVSVSGAGTAVKTLARPITVGAEPSFGVEDYQLIPEEAGGGVDTQAGSHPFQLTTVLTLNEQVGAAPVALPKNLHANWPAGLVGNPSPLAQCTDEQFGSAASRIACPPQSAIGVATVLVEEPGRPLPEHLDTFTQPLFNMVPRVGEPVRAGMKVAGLSDVFFDTAVRTGGDYGVTVSSNNISQTVGLVTLKATVWGVPEDPRHDAQRGTACVSGTGEGVCTPLAAKEPSAFLMMPTSCDEPFISTIEGVSWPAPGKPSESIPSAPGGALPTYTLPGRTLTGCNHLQFHPELSVAPDVPQASTPTGLTVHVHLPQTSALNPNGLAQSSLRDTKVVLPAGLTVNPGGADGLEACAEAQVGYLSREPGEPGRELFTPTIPPAGSFCPDGSKVGTVKIKLPILPHDLEGAVYLATQNANPFGSLIAMYIVAEDPVSGVLAKLPGEVSLDPVTGQLTSTFKTAPDAPLEDVELHFFGGSRAPLSTPPGCGSYTTHATFAPWSGNTPVTAESSFNINSGPNAGPCQSPRPFAPGFNAESTNIQAGAFTPFTTTMSRPDADQALGGLSLRMPPGFSGLLTGVKLCPEPQAAEGRCGPESLIGHTIVSAGFGSNPVTVKRPGEVFITGPYKGAPFGLSIVNPAEAGPFNLGNVTVRAKIEVDPVTAQLTVTSDPLPTILQGIPLQLQHVNVTIDRPGFTFNPTNCNPQSIQATLTSEEGATSQVSVPFQATNCATLGFGPKFAVSTSGKTSKANGASLSVKLTYPKVPFGSQANIKSVKVDLPKQLPSRLTTLQKACTAAQFEANPAGCPAASIVGHAKAITPLLPVPLEGPAYFVSHGGEAFPSLIMVLQGDNVTLDLVGTTFINKAGITSSTFKTVPDAPVGSFELNLPQGKFSALTANGNLCTSKPAMPTEFVAQNGAKLNQSTKIAVTGCPKTKALTRARKLAIALKACKKKRKGTKRTACQRKARRKYGPIVKKARKGTK
jgi:hypothetical protein